MVTIAASTPSADVPDINPTTFIAGILSPPARSRDVHRCATLIELWRVVKEANGQGLTGCSKSPPAAFSRRLEGSTYGPKYASPLRSLRPCWADFLNILRTFLLNGDLLASCRFLMSLTP